MPKYIGWYIILAILLTPTDNFYPPGLDRYWPTVAIEIKTPYKPGPPWILRDRKLMVKRVGL